MTKLPVPPFLTRNLGWKALALLLGTLVWATLRSGVPGRFRPTASLTLHRQPITVLTQPSDAHVFRVEPSEVSLSVQGPPEIMSNLSRDAVQAFVNLSGIPEGQPVLRRVHVAAPAGVSLVSVEPDEVTVLSEPMTPQVPQGP